MMSSRGIRNCNPGNIRRTKRQGVYRGERERVTDPDFREFVTMEWGYRAMFVLLNTYQYRYGLRTIKQMIQRWAPPSENNTRLYVDFVSRHSGVGADELIDTLDHDKMSRIVGAMSQMENGVEPDMSQVERGWELFYKDFGERKQINIS